MTGGGRTRLLLVTGLSGAGKSSALKVLEDLGYEVVDNLPLRLVPSLLRPEAAAAAAAGPAPALAIGVDTRTRDFAIDLLARELEDFRSRADLDVRVLFLHADDEVLRQRFSETRRRHPLAGDRPVTAGIRHERRLMAPLYDLADTVIDTSELSVADLRRVLAGYFTLSDRPGMSVFVTSFAFRHGLPREADLVFDVRFLANPHYDEHLRPLTGRDRQVVAFIEQDVDFTPFFDTLLAMLRPLLPRYAAEGKSYLTIAIGCTGGRHRSVMVAERLAARLAEDGVNVTISHRDIS